MRIPFFGKKTTSGEEALQDGVDAQVGPISSQKSKAHRIFSSVKAVFSTDPGPLKSSPYTSAAEHETQKNVPPLETKEEGSNEADQPTLQDQSEIPQAGESQETSLGDEAEAGRSRMCEEEINESAPSERSIAIEEEDSEYGAGVMGMLDEQKVLCKGKEEDLSSPTQAREDWPSNEDQEIPQVEIVESPTSVSGPLLEGEAQSVPEEEPPPSSWEVLNSRCKKIAEAHPIVGKISYLVIRLFLYIPNAVVWVGCLCYDFVYHLVADE